MKQQRFFIVFALFFIVKLHAQEFHLHMKATTSYGNSVAYHLPIEGVFLRQNIIGDTLTDGSYDLSIPVEQPCFLLINQLKIYAEPHKRLHIDYDYDKIKVVYSGDLHLENTILRRYRLDLSSINNLVDEFSKADNTPQQTYNAVMEARDKELNYLKTDCYTNPVSANFSRLVRWDILYAYASVFNRICLRNSYQRDGSPSPSAVEWRPLLEKNIGSLPLSNEEAVACESYMDFASYYVFSELKPFPNGITKKTCEEINNIPRLLKQKFNGKPYKMLFTEIFQSLAYQNDICVLPQYEIFKSENPNSLLIPYLGKTTDKLKDLVEAQKKTLAADIHIIDTLQIDTISQLFEKFKGKVIFGDVWATWCSPCKEEFAHKEALEAFAEKNDIVTLFISIDKTEKEELWKTMIKRYNLKGYNILLSQKLDLQLRQVLFGQDMVNIPRYFIIDKKGKIVIFDAPRPSSKETLLNQLRKFL